MLLTPHILIGALIGFKIQNPWLVFILAIISHFILDAIPHREYDIKALRRKKIDKQFIIELFQVITDLVIGVSTTIFFVWHSPSRNSAILGMMAAVIPDGITFLYWRTKFPIFKTITDFHRFTIHPKNNKNTPLIWGLGGQLLIIALAISAIIFK